MRTARPPSMQASALSSPPSPYCQRGAPAFPNEFPAGEMGRRKTRQFNYGRKKDLFPLRVLRVTAAAAARSSLLFQAKLALAQAVKIARPQTESGGGGCQSETRTGRKGRKRGGNKVWRFGAEKTRNMPGAAVALGKSWRRWWKSRPAA